jgi:hypothetical protein
MSYGNAENLEEAKAAFKTEYERWRWPARRPRLPREAGGGGRLVLTVGESARRFRTPGFGPYFTGHFFHVWTL